jgi:hypothetical protein
MHNGGKFDIFYMLHKIDTSKDMLIIKDRIVQCWVATYGGHHRLRDSYKILPFSLSTYKKDEIDYHKLESNVRENYKDEIVSYLRGDCVYLWELCTEYVKMFGPAVTIGATAMKELKKRHDVGEMLTGDIDSEIRTKYFLGGRVERFKKGVFNGVWKVYDVNSMYPYVMSHCFHPVGKPRSVTTHVTPDTYFVTARGFSRGAFPLRTKQGLQYAHSHGVYSITIHEWNTAHELGLFDCHEILECVNFDQSRMFHDYVMHYYNSRKHAKETGDKIKDIFFKFLLNNSYGKFAVNPANFKEYRLTEDTIDLSVESYVPEEIIPDFHLILWSKPSKEFKYANVATGASITGAARAVLMRGLSGAVNPIYCDTDSIICEELTGVTLDESTLGGWKLEKTGNLLAIAGRKMYALWDGERCVKYACKGVKIDPTEIRRAAEGETITYHRDAPTFRLSGSVDWITRRVRTV